MTSKSIGTAVPKFPQAGWLNRQNVVEGGRKLKGWTAVAVNKIKTKQQAKGAKRAA